MNKIAFYEIQGKERIKCPLARCFGKNSESVRRTLRGEPFERGDTRIYDYEGFLDYLIRPIYQDITVKKFKELEDTVNVIYEKKGDYSETSLFLLQVEIPEELRLEKSDDRNKPSYQI